jgi:endonuclease/exonuclease/phosphatase family metal-dependent hydrolase
MARVIAEKHPDLVALHEASMLRTGPPNAPPPPSASTIEMDLIRSLLRELEKLGAPYDLMYIGPAQFVIESTRTNLDAEAPSTLPFNVRITDRDAIIARTDNDDIQMTALEVHDFSDVQTIPTPVGSIIIPSGWIQLDATIRGRPFRFVSVHLDPGPCIDIQWLQAKELLTNTCWTNLPIVFGGDFNAPPVNVPENTHYKVYQELTQGFTDAWKKDDDPGFTCCQDSDLRNPDSKLIYRIDLVLYRAGADWDFDVENIELVGDKQADKTQPSGLWPSDHAGVVATLAFTPRKVD